ncbi:receptor-type tyrosine-protein phosphatase epsilon [Amia ocellicauda]|uniref:receptor-type tyrosine-protein phosphatase epsilon n=1 Tax=Amia ocellicauda TaxID=2972642 RepID=UPI0034640F8E
MIQKSIFFHIFVISFVAIQASKHFRNLCSLQRLHNITDRNVSQVFTNGMNYTLKCSEGFIQIKKVVQCITKHHAFKWTSEKPCVEKPKLWLNWNESSSENISVTWNYTRNELHPYYLNITMTCQLEISFGQNCSGHRNTTVHQDGDTAATCMSLQPFSSYSLKFTVNIYKNVKRRLLKRVPLETKETFIISTAQTVPDKPELEFVPSSGWLQWKPLSNCAGRITAYELNYRGKREYNKSFEESYSLLVNSSVTTCALPHLKSATNYSLEVRGFTEAGAGDASHLDIETELKEPALPDIGILTMVNITGGTALIRLLPAFDTNGPISCYQVIVLEHEPAGLMGNTSLAHICSSTELVGSRNMSSGRVYIAREIQPENLTELSEFTLGDGGQYGKFHNVPLQLGKNYSILIRVISRWKQDRKFSCSEYESFYIPAAEQQIADHLILLIALCASVPLMCSLVAFVYITWRRTHNWREPQSKRSVHLSVLIHPGPLDGADLSDKQDPAEEILQHMLRLKQEAWRGEHSEEEHGLTKEFKSLPKNCSGTCDAAKELSNKAKNRYRNSVPYDASRVILTSSLNDPGCNYINASYIGGLEKPNCYIATQGPLPNTVADFWRMVWQQKTSIIVMLTGVIEGNKTKCEKYWPDELQVYGDIQVTLQAQTIDSEVTTRVFGLQEVGGCKHRSVRQFHYTVWPDHGTPKQPLSLLRLIRQTNRWMMDTSGPIVVHCSAGIGRTGTFIAVHQLLATAERGHSVNVSQCVSNMRRSRDGMVQNERQYMLVYDVLLEALLCSDTQFPASEIHQQVRERQKQRPHSPLTGYETEMQALKRLSALHLAAPHCTALKPTNQSKNRDISILPADDVRCPLMSVTGPDGSPGYINAVFADGFIKKNRFIITQLPLKATVIDFWSLVYDYKCSTVVIMDKSKHKDETFPVFWPRSAVCTHGPFSISLCKEDQKDGFTSRSLKLSHTKQRMESTLQINMFQLDNWPEGDTVPKTTDTIIRLCIEAGQSQDSPIVVMCRDGACRSGLFCVASVVWEQLQAEGQVDVFQSLKTLHRARPQLVKDMDQYIFCYNIAANCIDP